MTLRTDSTPNSNLTNCAENGLHHVPSAGICQEREHSSIGHVVRELRKEKGMSQGELAKRAHINRTTIARLERGVFKSVSLAHLEGIATAFEMDLQALLLTARPASETADYRGRFNQVAFSLEYPEYGFRIGSITPKRKEFFFGKIEIFRQTTVPSSVLPHPKLIYIHFIEGRVILTRDVQEFLLKPGDCIAFSGNCEYELYNPDLLKKSSAIFITYPSFISV